MVAARPELLDHPGHGSDWSGLSCEAAGSRTDDPKTDPIGVPALRRHSAAQELALGTAESFALSAVKLFTTLPEPRTMFRDLKKAGIKQTDEMGRCADYHALRHTFAKRLDETSYSHATRRADASRHR